MVMGFAYFDKPSTMQDGLASPTVNYTQQILLDSTKSVWGLNRGIERSHAARSCNDARVAAVGSEVLRGFCSASQASKSARRITLGLVVDGEENGSSPSRQACSIMVTEREAYIAAIGTYICMGQF